MPPTVLPSRFLLLITSRVRSDTMSRSQATKMAMNLMKVLPIALSVANPSRQKWTTMPSSCHCSRVAMASLNERKARLRSVTSTWSPGLSRSHNSPPAFLSLSLVRPETPFLPPFDSLSTKVPPHRAWSFSL